MFVSSLLAPLSQTPEEIKNVQEGHEKCARKIGEKCMKGQRVDEKVMRMPEKFVRRE